MSGVRSSATAIVAYEDALYRALESGDFEGLAGLLAEDACWIHDSGVVESADDAIAGLRHGLHKYGHTEVVERHVRPLGSEAALSHSIVDMLDQGHGKPFRLRLHQTLVWTRQDGRWRIVIWHVTRVPI
jgi:uncharacterized protein (TIGR02246 family)